MRHWLASLMAALWCVGMAGAAPGHVDVWATGLDGHVHVAHAQALQTLARHDFDVHEHGLPEPPVPALAGHHHHDLALAIHGDTSRIPSASHIPPPSQKPVPHALILAPILSRPDRPGRGTFVGGDPPWPLPSLLQHRSVVLRI